MNKKMLKGFTLIEIMIVVAIIAILAAVAIPNFIKYQKQSVLNTCISTKASIKTAAESYAIANPSATEIATSDLYDSDGTGFLKEAPKCKQTDTDTYTITKDASSGVITVTCSNHDTGN